MDAFTRWWFDIKNKKKDSGQTLVELALVLPFLLILIFGAIEFGRIFHATHVITSAAREGARAAAVGKPNTTTGTETKRIDSIDEAVKKAVSSLVSESQVYIKDDIDDFNAGDPDDGQIYYYIDPEDYTDRTLKTLGDDVTVTVKGAVEVIAPIVGGLLPQNPIILKSYATFRLE